MEQPSQPFSVFIQTLLDKVEHAKGVNKKKAILNDFLQDWRRLYGLNYYDPLSLIMPNYSKRMYHMQEATLATVISKALLLGSKHPDANYLKNYRVPYNGKPCGVFHAAAYDVIARRSTVTSSERTVHDVSELLDRLAGEDELSDKSEKSHIRLFRFMIDNYTPHQIQWIIRIILKDLNFRLSEQSVLSVLHPNAKDLFDTGRTLKELCKSIENPHGAESSFNGVQLFSPCLPQLGLKYTSKQTKDFEKLSKPFYLEQKLDGERMLLHYDPRVDKFMWFTRRKNDNSKRYGTSSNSSTKLSSRICDRLPKRSVILDGEMVAYDPVIKGFLPFGTLKSTSVNEDEHENSQLSANVDINDPTKPHPCYVVFDILFYDGKSIINSPLEERIKLLNIVVKNQNQHLMLMTRQQMSTMEEVTLALEEAVKKQQEGLVIKDPASKYVLNSRLNTWLKFKPEFMDSMEENCDVLVVGAKYGSGSYGGSLRQILCAVLDDSEPVKPLPRHVQTQTLPKFHTFAMVHSGLKDSDVSVLNSITENVEKYFPGRVPGWVSHPLNSNERPDRWFYFENALVAEIKGAEVTPSVQFALGNTLRFPRLVKFRHDKGWKNVMKLSEFKKMQLEKRRGEKRKAEDREEFNTRPSKRGGFHFLPSQLPANISEVPVETLLFEGFTFYVMNGTKKYNKQDIEIMIHRNGGKIKQDRKPGVIIIGSDEDNIPQRLRIFRDKKMYDVTRARWIVDCVELQDLLPLEPKYMYITLDETRDEFLKRMDIYDDPYTKHLTDEQTRELHEIMGKDESQSDEERRAICQQTMKECFSDQTMQGFLFLNNVAYFDYDTSMDIDEPPIEKTIQWAEWRKNSSETEFYQNKFEFELGDVRLSGRDQDVTHVVVNQNDLSRLDMLRNEFHRTRLPRFVTLEWIQACIDNRTLVNELDYQPKIPTQL